MLQNRTKSVLLGLSGLILVSHARHARQLGGAITAFAVTPISGSFSTPRQHRVGATTTTTKRQLQANAAAVDFVSYEELPSDFPRRDDVLAALTAVRGACLVARNLQPDSDENDGAGNTGTVGTVGVVAKPDLSPVTVADFAVQGLILHALNEQFPDDGFIAEEDSTSLQTDDRLCQQVAAAASLPRDELVKAIDLGKSYRQWCNAPRPPRVWVLDPIDGTRGFLRGKLCGGQYAIALALIEDGAPVIGILGCPNLPVEVDDENYAWTDSETASNNCDTRGCVFVASRGGGCYQLSLLEPNNSNTAVARRRRRRLHVTPESARSTRDARFCIGVERYSDALGQCGDVAKYVHGDDRALDGATGEIVRARRMDSQAKHGVIARGGAELYARLPKPGYVEWIWDHAAGNVVIEEAGGTMTDVAGRPIDFSLGAQLSPDVRGVLMSAGGAFHTSLVDAFEAVEAPKAQ